MTMENVISGFGTTGVYPINRAVVSIKTPVKSRMSDLETKKPITFLFIEHNTTFTTEEILCFQRCYEEGYNLETDVRYNKWVDTYHPQGTPQPLSSHDGKVFPLFFHVHLIFLDLM